MTPGALLSLLLRKPPAAGSGQNGSFIGGFVTSGTQAFAFPAGTQVGDLAIIMSGGFAPIAPAGYTTAFSSPADPNSYVRRVSYRVLTSTAGISATNESVFDGYVVVLRGPTSVSSLYQYATRGGGTSGALVAPAAGTLIVSASDRGGNPAGIPSLSPSPDNTFTGNSQNIFTQRTGVYLNKPINTNVIFTDFGDAYATTGIMAVAV